MKHENYEMRFRFLCGLIIRTYIASRGTKDVQHTGIPVVDRDDKLVG